MRKLLILFVAALGVALFAGEGLTAQEDPLRPRGKDIGKVRKRIETLRMWRLTEALDLDEATASKLFPVINGFDKKRFELERKIRTDIDNLRTTIEETSEEALKETVDRLEKNHRRLRELNDEELKKLKEVMTVKQFARFIIFRQEFDEDMKRLVSRAKEKRMRRPVETAPPGDSSVEDMP